MYHIKKDKRSIQSSEAIYNALMFIAQEKQCKDISITEIVAQAQVGRATFYRNFDCIDDVMRYKLDQNLEQIWSEIKSYYSDANNTIPTRNTIILKIILHYIYNNSTLYHLIVHDERYDLLRENFMKLIQDYLFPFFNQDNNIPNSVSKNFEYFVEVNSTLLIAIINKWLRDGLTITPDDMVELVNGIELN